MSTTLTPHPAADPDSAAAMSSRPLGAPAVDVEIVVAVYNEARALPGAIHHLHAYLCHRFPFSWQITIADNASTDGTTPVARALAAELPRVRALHLDQKGRGRALRAAWSASSARVVAYMDVDLSTDLKALAPLVSPLLSGHSEVAIGSRLARGGSVQGGTESITAWVKVHYRAVTIGGQTVYDLTQPLSS